MTIKKFLIVFMTIALVYSCSKPIDKIKNITWEGQVYRYEDDKQLSDVKLKLSNDTMYIFSNAIFGADYDTLLIQKNENEKDSTLILKNLDDQQLKLKYKYIIKEKGDNFYLIGDDFYVVTGISNQDIFEKDALSFYKNISVPTDAYMYLDGAYEGEMELENSFMNLYLSQIGGIKIKMVFIDDFKVRIYVKNLMMDMFGGGSKGGYETVKYRVDGNTLILENKNSDGGKINVKNNGRSIVFETDKANVVLNKIY